VTTLNVQVEDPTELERFVPVQLCDRCERVGGRSDDGSVPMDARMVRGRLALRERYRWGREEEGEGEEV
jgi:hypothetical protein